MRLERIRESAGVIPGGQGEGYLKIREQRSTGKESKTPDSVVARTNQKGRGEGKEEGTAEGRREEKREKSRGGEEEEKTRRSAEGLGNLQYSTVRGARTVSY
jgi:hypothetical protein